MAIAFDNCQNGSSTLSSITIAGYAVAGSDRVMYVGIGVDAASDFNGISGARDGQSFTFLTPELSTGRYLTVARLIAPNTGSADLVISGLPGGGNQNVVAINFTGVDQTTPEDTSVTSSNTTGSSTSTGAMTSAVGDLVLDFIHVDTDVTASLAVGAGTRPANGTTAAALGSTAAVSYEAGAASVTKQWTWTANRAHSHFVLNLNAAGGGGGSTAVPVFIHHLRQQGIL
jgi:hypothetical protein